MRLLDARRLTGPNLQTSAHAAIAEVAFDAGDDAAAALAAFRDTVAKLHAWVGLDTPEITERRFDGGAAWCVSAPLDALGAEVDLIEKAVEHVVAGRQGAPASVLHELVGGLRAVFEMERDPALRALEAEASRRDVGFLWDDDAVSVGFGARSARMSRHELPSIEAVDWGALGRLPVAYVTGTNGKTTTVRLLCRIAREAGLRAGATTTDGVTVDGELVDPGDWTGPGGARAVLRRTDIDLAILEAARGGILRRGLAVDRVDAAVITNIAADHLGEYGVTTLDEMARAKAVVGRAVKPDGRVVLNASDATLATLEGHFAAPIAWFSRQPAVPRIAEAIASGGECAFVRDRSFVLVRAGVETVLCAMDDVPICFGGTATHNVDNVLAATLCARALDLPDAAIGAALMTFGTALDDNPGRANVIDIGGVKVVLDFGHNPAGVEGVTQVAHALLGRGGRLFVSFAQAGDRDDETLRAFVRAIAAGRPDRLVVRELEHYLRGRAPGVVPAILMDEARRLGFEGDRVTFEPDEVRALEAMTTGARSGDVALLLVHVERAAVRAWLDSRIGHAGGDEADRKA